MKPIRFKEYTRYLYAPEGMPEVKPLPIHDDGEYLLSCWRPTLRERLSVLLFGRVWLWLHTRSHPPVTIKGWRSAFNQLEEKADGLNRSIGRSEKEQA